MFTKVVYYKIKQHNHYLLLRIKRKLLVSDFSYKLFPFQFDILAICAVCLYGWKFVVIIVIVRIFLYLNLSVKCKLFTYGFSIHFRNFYIAQ